MASIVALLSLSACADDLSDLLDVEEQELPRAGEKSESERGMDATVQVIDASDAEAWSYLDLSTGAIVTPATPEDSREWDLGFRRYLVALNGGVSGTGGVEVAVLRDAYENIDRAPLDGYFTDLTDGADTDEDDDLALVAEGSAWYSYDSSMHTLSPNPRVYVIHAVEGDYFKLEFLDYYNAAGSAGYPSIRFDPVAAPGD